MEGVASLTGRCLTQGAAGRTAEEFADALALYGADLEGSAFADGFAVRLAVPATHLEDGPEPAGRCASIRPEFLVEEVDHERRLATGGDRAGRAYPQHVAVERLNAARVRRRPRRPTCRRRSRHCADVDP